jgi:magnesium-transporting ATPase (P-type)
MYEFIPSKLPSYAFAAMPALAFFIAKILNEINFENVKKLYIGWFLQLFLVTSLGITLLWVGNQPEKVVELSKLSLDFAITTQKLVNIFIPMFLIFNFLACYFWYRSEKQKGFLASLGISLTFLVFVWTLLTGFNLERSICHETAQLTAREPSRKVIFTTYLGLPSLPFYVGKKNVYEFEKEWNIEKLVLRFSSSEPLFLLISEEDLGKMDFDTKLTFNIKAVTFARK